MKRRPPVYKPLPTASAKQLCGKFQRSLVSTEKSISGMLGCMPLLKAATPKTQSTHHANMDRVKLLCAHLSAPPKHEEWPLVLVHVILVGPIFGAEVWGIDLSKPLSPADLETVSSLFHRYKAHFFRKQDGVLAKDLEQVRLCKQLSAHWGIEPRSSSKPCVRKTGYSCTRFCTSKKAVRMIGKLRRQITGARV